MADNNRDDKPYIKEKIKRSNSDRFFRWILRFLAVACMAILFGVAAGVAFVVARPWAEKLGVTQETEETTRYAIDLPVYTEDTTTETQTVVTTEETTTVDEAVVELSDDQKSWIRSQISSALARYNLTATDIDEMDGVLSTVYKNAGKCLTTIRGYNGDNLTLSITGVIFYNVKDAEDVLILTNTSATMDVDRLTVTFSALDNREFEATLCGYDHVYGLSVVAVSTDGLTEADMNKIAVMNLGNNYKVNECDTVMIVGNPYVAGDTVAVGRITRIVKQNVAIDSVYTMFYTDMALPEGATGFMVNTSGELVGIMCSALPGDITGFATAVGTDEITGALNCMASGAIASLLGVYGQTVTVDMIEINNMPEGVYVSNVLPDSAAYNAGISAGDVIVGMSTEKVSCIEDLTDALLTSHLPNETVIVKIMRDSAEGYKEMDINVTLGAR
ncbi:MAG: S1C family serine protease [Lachnospiraceae bacterium]|nr:S1C family serine protease [Lachnospiraceae bacterium]